MKTFEGRNHYEVLEVPWDADLNAIERAYHKALDIYKEDSLVTYSLFSEEQRADLLHAIDAAFHTLSDEQKRAAYNQMLIDSGRIDASVFQDPPGQNQPETLRDAPSPIQHRDLNAWVKQKSKDETIKQLIDDVVAKDMISGSDLKQLREAFDIEIAQIFKITRISKTTLAMIEDNQFDSLPADVFLKSFLKSYAQILQIDPQPIVEGYFKYRALAGRSG
jgi:curved DNA-binding protein CbpA